MKSSFKVSLIDIFKTRSWLYQFLGKGFYNIPTLDRLNIIADNNIFEKLVKIGDESKGTEILAEFFKQCPFKDDEYIDKIKDEHYRLFMGPGHVPCPPWESVYVGKERIIFDKNTLTVRQFYRNWDVSVERLNKEPDDHIGFELQFIGILSQKTIRALEKSDMVSAQSCVDAQKGFLESHLLCWAGDFCKKVLENTQEPLYKGLAEFTREFLDTDDEILEDINSALKKLCCQGDI